MVGDVLPSSSDYIKDEVFRGKVANLSQGTGWEELTGCRVGGFGGMGGGFGRGVGCGGGSGNGAVVGEGGSLGGGLRGFGGIFLDEVFVDDDGDEGRGGDGDE